MLRTANTVAFVILVLGVLFVLGGAFFIVPETKQAVIMQFGRPVHVIAGTSPPKNYVPGGDESVRVSHGAGLYFRIPFVQQVVLLEDRLLEYDSAPKDVVTKDKKHLLVDNFARWRIVDPLTFYRAVRTESAAGVVLDDVVYSAIRGELAKHNLVEIVRTTDRPELPDKLEVGREHILEAILYRCDVGAADDPENRGAREFGIQVVDVRIKRADLPPENRTAVYGRMNAERSRVAKGYRSEGEEEALKIRAETDRDVQIIKAEAYRDAERIKGEGDAQAAAIYADAYGKHADFYAFTKSLEVIAATTSVRDQLIIGMDDGVYQYLK